MGNVSMHTRAFFIGLVIAVGSFLPANAHDSGETTSMMSKRFHEQREELPRNSISSLVPANRSISGSVAEQIESE